MVNNAVVRHSIFSDYKVWKIYSVSFFSDSVYLTELCLPDSTVHINVFVEDSGSLASMHLWQLQTQTVLVKQRSRLIRQQVFQCH